LPFLRFTRDKRGYETTSLVHAIRGRHGRTRQKLLYWFRSPPNVKVGRPALDEDAIRWIEEHNPDIDFDWPKILDAKPPAAPPEEGRDRRSQQRGKGRGGKVSQPESERAEMPAPPPPPEEPVRDDARGDDASVDEISVEPAIESAEEQAFEQLTHPDAEELPPVAEMPATIEAMLGHEQLTRLRARFAEVQRRITERGGDPAQIESLRARAETLNPDTWVTADDARKGVEQFEGGIRDLRAALGLRRRRRSRRGGRRRRRNPETAPAPAEGAGPTSNDTEGEQGE